MTVLFMDEDRNYIVCPSASDVVAGDLPNLLQCDCAAGCGARIAYPGGIPQRMPKVCIDCSKWLARPMGHA